MNLEEMRVPGIEIGFQGKPARDCLRVRLESVCQTPLDERQLSQIGYTSEGDQPCFLAQDNPENFNSLGQPIVPLMTVPIHFRCARSGCQAAVEVHPIWANHSQPDWGADGAKVAEILDPSMTPCKVMRREQGPITAAPDSPSSLR